MPELLDVIQGNNNDDLYTSIIKTNLAERILVLNDDIDEMVLENYALHILNWNREDKDKNIDKRKTITIYISSPGGSAFDGQVLVDAMMASKTKIKVVAMGLVASMGYHIYLAGSERFAFPNAVLLQHEGETVVANSSSKARDTMRFFDSMAERTKQFILDRTTMTEEFYDKVYEQEYWMYAQEAKELGVVHKIIGEDCDLDEVI